MNKNKLAFKNIFELFITFFKIGAFTFGGGYAMIPLIEREFVTNKKWVDKDEFIDIVSISQSFPGVLAANCSSFIGNKLFGFPGAVLALFGVCLPSIICIVLIAAFFTQFRSNPTVDVVMKGINAGVPPMIFIALFSFSKNLEKNAYNILIFIVSLVALIVFRIHPFFVIIAAAILGIIKDKGGFTR